MPQKIDESPSAPSAAAEAHPLPAIIETTKAPNLRKPPLISVPQPVKGVEKLPIKPPPYPFKLPPSPIQLPADESNQNVPSTDTSSHVVTRDVNSFGLDSALLIIAANRPQYLDRTLSHVIKYHPKKSLPIIISHDGNHEEVNQIITKYQTLFHQTSDILFDSILFQPTPSNKYYENGYFRLADHFKFAINTIFNNKNGYSSNNKQYFFQRIIILEEDLQISSDFYEYFASLFPLLDNPNQHLLTISAWNDNGFNSLVKDPKQIYRSDFFPGLGWMLTRSLWENELSTKWPRAYWDDWLREPKNRQGRHILRPEISRTLHFGTHGVSNAQYSNYLNTMKLNDQFIEFTKLDHSYLLEENWDREYLNHVKQAKVVTIHNYNQIIQANPNIQEVKIYYNSLDENSWEEDSYRKMSEWSGVMNNVKAGVPRTAYKSIVSFWKGNVKVHLVSKNSKY